MTNIIHVEHKCDIETTMLEIWTLMYLYNDSEWHLPITLIWESEKSCRCALVAAFILTLFDVNLLESKFKNSRADFSTILNEILVCMICSKTEAHSPHLSRWYNCKWFASFKGQHLRNDCDLIPDAQEFSNMVLKVGYCNDHTNHFGCGL